MRKNHKWKFFRTLERIERMIAILSLISLLLWAYLIGKARQGTDLVKLVTFALCAFFFLYTVVSAGFFWADCFQFERTLAVCIVIEAAAIGVLRKLCGEGTCAAETGAGGEKAERAGGWQFLLPDVTWDIKKYWIPVLIAVLALPFTWNKFELYSMGQDQGTYQVKALALMEYDTHNYIEMEEFTKLETAEEKQKYLDFVYGQNNLYLPRVIEETKTDASEFDHIIGTIHGLPTYSALLALWGKIFGYAEMIGVQTVLYLCLIFLAYFTAENTGLGRGGAAAVTALTAFSPIVVWGSKSSLTEIGLAVIFAVFLYTLTSGGRNSYLAGIPIAAFAFFHISIYVFMPVFVIALFLMYFLEKEKGWLVSLLVTLAGYLLSAFWSFSIAPYYSYGNYSVLWKLTRNLINENNIKPFIVVLCVLLALLICFLMSGKGETFAEKIKNAAGSSLFWNIVVWGSRLFLVFSVLFFGYKGIVRAEYIRYCQYLQISTYIYMTGLVLIPAIYLLLIWKTRRFVREKMTAVLTLLFFYCVIAYSMFMRLDVLFYYYYARYVTIFLPVVFLLAGKLLAAADSRGRVSAVLFLLALVSFVPYDVGLVTQKDHTRCEWEVLADVCEDITAEDAFIVGPDEQQIVFIFPVKLLTGCDVYYADENLRGQIGKLSLRYRNIYYLDYDGALEEKMAADENWRDGALSVQKIYTNWNHLSYLDYFNITNPLTPIPLNYVEYRLKLSLHEITLNR